MLGPTMLPAPVPEPLIVDEVATAWLSELVALAVLLEEAVMPAGRVGEALELAAVASPDDAPEVEAVIDMPLAEEDDDEPYVLAAEQYWRFSEATEDLVGSSGQLL